MFSGHHGNTPAAWTCVIIVFIGFCVGGAAVVMANPPLMWVGIGVIAVGGLVGKAMQMAGLGKSSSHGSGAGAEATADAQH